MALESLVRKCEENNFNHQVHDVETGLNFCSYGIALPCYYQGQPYFDKDSNVRVPCNYVMKDKGDKDGK